jgi:hypothetical protein
MIVKYCNMVELRQVFKWASISQLFSGSRVVWVRGQLLVMLWLVCEFLQSLGLVVAYSISREIIIAFHTFAVFIN